MSETVVGSNPSTIDTPGSVQADPNSALAAVGVDDSPMAKHQKGRSYEGSEDSDSDFSLGEGDEGDTQEAKAEEKARTEAKKQWKLKVNDRELVIDDEEKLTQLAQKGALLDHRYREVVRAKKEAYEIQQAAREQAHQAQQILQSIKENPLQALMQLFDGDEDAVRQAIQPFVYEKTLQDIEDERNPHQKALREERMKRERLEARLQQQEQAEQQKRQAEERAQWQKHYQEKIMGLIKSNKLPPSPRVLKAFADQIYRANKLGIEPNIEQIAENTRLSLNEEVAFTAGDTAKRILEAHAKGDTGAIMDGLEELQRVLGEGIVKAIRIGDLARLKKSRQNFPETQFVQTDTPKSEAVNKPKGYMDMDDWRDETRRRAAALQQPKS